MPATASTYQSRAARGSGTRRQARTGRMIASATTSRTAAKVTGGRSRSPILMNSHTLLQIKQVTHQTTRVINVARCTRLSRTYSRGRCGGRRDVEHSFSLRSLRAPRETVRGRPRKLSLLLGRRGLPRRGAAGVEVVPVEDRVEAEEEVPLRLPAPVRAVGEHHHVPLADRRVDGHGAAGQRF